MTSYLPHIPFWRMNGSTAKRKWKFDGKLDEFAIFDQILLKKNSTRGNLRVEYNLLSVF